MAAAARASLLRGDQGREQKICAPQGTTPDTKLPQFLNLFAHNNIHILSYGVSYFFLTIFGVWLMPLVMYAAHTFTYNTRKFKSGRKDFAD